MKGSEALLRAIANEGGEIPAVKLLEWSAQLQKAGLLEQIAKEDDNDVFYWRLTDRARAFLKSKGVTV